MTENWVLKNKTADLAHLSERFGISNLTAKILANKGLKEDAEIEAFLNPKASDMHHYSKFKNMSKAVSIIKKAIDNGEHICIVGDYDVDGVVSTYLLLTAFTELGAYVSFKIPDRITDGYGINVGIIEKAIEEGTDLIVTCDNGISANSAIAYAKEQGLTVVVTDHHNVPDELPNADCIVDPKQADCEYPFEGICGAVVAAKLCEALFNDYGFGPFIERFMDVLAIATVCDVMELVDENRYIVKRGLEVLNNTGNTGLKALIEKTGLENRKLSVYSLGFVLGPCLNATGRLESAIQAVELLKTGDPSEAALIADRLKELNDTRKDMTMKQVERAITQVESSGMIEDSVLLLYLPGCHESLAGIVAGRIREHFNRPAIVMTDSTADDEMLKGSGRSTDDYNMYEGLKASEEYIFKYGGHPKAAGLSVMKNRLDSLRQSLNEKCTEDLAHKPLKVMIDISMAPTSLSVSLLNELEILAPFGNGNPSPVFADSGMELVSIDRFGREGQYLKLGVNDSKGRRCEMKLFRDCDGFIEKLEDRYGEIAVRNAQRGSGKDLYLSAIYKPEINEYKGNVSLQFSLERFKLPQKKNSSAGEESEGVSSRS